MLENQPTIGREILTTGAQIAGIVSCVPRNEVWNDHLSVALQKVILKML